MPRTAQSEVDTSRNCRTLLNLVSTRVISTHGTEFSRQPTEQLHRLDRHFRTVTSSRTGTIGKVFQKRIGAVSLDLFLPGHDPQIADVTSAGNQSGSDRIFHTTAGFVGV